MMQPALVIQKIVIGGLPVKSSLKITQSGCN